MTALAVTATVAAGLFTGVDAATGAPKPPPTPTVDNPTNQQLQRADAQRAAIDNQIGQLAGQIAGSQAEQQNLQRKAELAEQKVAYAISERREADAAAEQAVRASKRAQHDVEVATQQVKQAQTRFAQYMQAIYADGRPEGLTGTLLTAQDPTALLDQTSYQQYDVERNAGVIGQMQTLSIKRSNTRAAAERARAAAERAKVKAKQKQEAEEQALQVAATAVQVQQVRTTELQGEQNQAQVQLTAAKAQQVQLYNNRATYTQYVQQLNAYNAYVAEQRRLAAIARQQALERAQQRAAAERAKERAKQNRNKGGGHKGGGNSGGGGSSSGGGSSDDDDPPAYSPPAPSGGSWSSAKAAKAVARAKSTLGTPYAWAGGGVRGPSYGACVPSAGAPNDCYVRGYDCSGLVMYAWGKSWDHYADTQYSQAGSYHPKRSQLKAGDLVFFGYRNGGSDLHHVAMYIGGGRIIEAPYSGGYVQYNRLSAYSDYYGATRPLT